MAANPLWTMGATRDLVGALDFFQQILTGWTALRVIPDAGSEITASKLSTPICIPGTPDLDERLDEEVGVWLQVLDLYTRRLIDHFHGIQN